MSFFETMLDRYRSYPRAMRWALAAGVGILVFMVWSDVIQRQTDAWNAEADRLLDDARKIVEFEERTLGGRMKYTILAVGEVQVPRHAAEAGPVLTRIVDEVVRKHGASKDNYNQRNPVKLRPGTLQEVVGPGARVEKLTAALRFNATPEAATAIVAELESRPEIEAISSLRVTRNAGAGRVTVDLVLDAWIRSSEAGSGAGGSS